MRDLAPWAAGIDGIERRVQFGMLAALALIEPRADRPQPPGAVFRTRSNHCGRAPAAAAKATTPGLGNYPDEKAQ